MNTPPVGKAALITGWILTIVPNLLILFSAVMKLAHPPQLDEGFAHLGVPVTQAFGLGVLELSCVVVYLIPRTAVTGAILLTGYLGGAMEVHVRIGEAVVPHVILIIALWGGIFLRDPRLRALIPLRRPSA